MPKAEYRIELQVKIPRTTRARYYAARLLIALAAWIVRRGRVEAKVVDPPAAEARPAEAFRLLTTRPMTGRPVIMQSGFELVPDPGIGPAQAFDPEKMEFQVGSWPRPTSVVDGDVRVSGCRGSRLEPCQGEGGYPCRTCTVTEFQAACEFDRRLHALGLPRDQRDALRRKSEALITRGKNPGLIQGPDGGYDVAAEAEPEPHQLATWEDDGGRPPAAEARGDRPC